MYQHSLFAEQSSRGAQFLGAGCFSTAHRLSNGLVCKTGMNDMTRNWLEFCMLEREAGRLRPLMPEVYQVVPLGEHNYSAIMAEYQGWRESGHGRKADDVDQEAGFTELYEDFKRYLTSLDPYAVGRCYEVFNDLHGGNVMYSTTRGWIITDPSSCDYVTMSARPELELH